MIILGLSRVRSNGSRSMFGGFFGCCLAWHCRATPVKRMTKAKQRPQALSQRGGVSRLEVESAPGGAGGTRDVGTGDLPAEPPGGVPTMVFSGHGIVERDISRVRGKARLLEGVIRVEGGLKSPKFEISIFNPIVGLPTRAEFFAVYKGGKRKVCETQLGTL